MTLTAERVKRQARELGADKVRAVVVLQAGYGEEARAALEAHLRHTLPRYKLPRWIDFVDTLPKTPTGKIQRFALRQAES